MLTGATGRRHDTSEVHVTKVCLEFWEEKKCDEVRGKY